MALSCRSFAARRIEGSSSAAGGVTVGAALVVFGAASATSVAFSSMSLLELHTNDRKYATAMQERSGEEDEDEDGG